MQTKYDTILVLDFGGQYCHLIGRRIREHGIYSEIVPSDITVAEVSALKNKFNIKGIIFSGGPSSVYDSNAPQVDSKILDLGIPILGLCYGHHLIAQLVQGKVTRATCKEYGTAEVNIDKAVGVLNGLSEKETVWMSHGDTVTALPSDYEVLAHTDSCPIAAYRNKDKAIYGLQWHPEVVHTKHGAQMLRNFIFEVCQCTANWNVGDVIEKMVKEIKADVGDSEAIIGLSGGIDSSVATALAAQALGNKLTAVFVDHGFMREGEPEAIRETFSKFNINFVMAEAQQRFMKKLEGVSEPDVKQNHRRRIHPRLRRNCRKIWRPVPFAGNHLPRQN
jgi:GMP synthase (glutamine-hydrolysing)